MNHTVALPIRDAQIPIVNVPDLTSISSIGLRFVSNKSNQVLADGYSKGLCRPGIEASPAKPMQLRSISCLVQKTGEPSAKTVIKQVLRDSGALPLRLQKDNQPAICVD